MKVFITGVAGFIGSSIANWHLDNGDEVIGADAFTDYYDVKLKHANVGPLIPRMTDFIDTDLLTVDLAEAFSGIDVVYHQAGQPGVRRSWGADFQHYTRNNVELTQKVLEAAKQNPKLKRLVYASSSSVYGDAHVYPTSEKALPMPLSPYGVSKLAAEHLCGLYAANYGVPTVSLRYFTVYGPKQRPDMAFNAFIRSILTNQPIRVFGNGEQLRDFTYIDDIVNANIAAATSDVSPGAVLNIAGGSNVSVNEILGLLGEISGRQIVVERTDKVAGDVFRTGGATDAARSLLNWKPNTSLEEGLSRQYRWMERIAEVVKA